MKGERNAQAHTRETASSPTHLRGVVTNRERRGARGDTTTDASRGQPVAKPFQARRAGHQADRCRSTPRPMATRASSSPSSVPTPEHNLASDVEGVGDDGGGSGSRWALAASGLLTRGPHQICARWVSMATAAGGGRGRLAAATGNCGTDPFSHGYASRTGDHL